MNLPHTVWSEPQVVVFVAPQMDTGVEFAKVREDVSMTLDALRRGDVNAVGFITLNLKAAGRLNRKMNANSPPVSDEIKKSRNRKTAKQK